MYNREYDNYIPVACHLDSDYALFIELVLEHIVTLSLEALVERTSEQLEVLCLQHRRHL